MDVRLVNYFYFLRDDVVALDGFRKQIIEVLGFTSSGIKDLFSPGGPEGASLIASRLADDTKVHLYLALLSDVSVLILVWDGGVGVESESIRELAASADMGRRSMLGETTVFVGHCHEKTTDISAASLLEPGVLESRRQHLCVDCGIRGESLMLTGPFGSLCHMPPDDEQRSHYFLLSPDAELKEALFNQLATQRIPKLDMAVRRLRQKQDLFQDQRIAIESEHRAMDSAVGRFFHREAAQQHDVGDHVRSERLAEEIGRLSQIYAILATDAQLVKEAENAFRQELESLHRSAAEIAGHSGALESTIVMYYDGRFGPEVKALTAESSALGLSLERVEAAVDIVRTEVDLLRGSETMEIQTQTKELLRHNVALQQERMALLVAAHVIEFVIIFYYSLSSWDAIVGLERIEQVPELVRFGLIALLASSAVFLTHMIARSIQSRHAKRAGLVAAALMTLFLFGLIIGTTVYWT